MNIQPDENGNLVFDQTIYDDNGDDLTVQSVRWTAQDGAPVASPNQQPAWLAYTVGPKQIDLANDGRSYRTISFTIPFDELVDGVFEITVQFSDGNFVVATPFDIILDPAPAAPSTLEAVGGASSGEIDLTWDAPADEDLLGYNVYRADSVLGTYTQINGSTVLTESYTDATATPGEDYWYRVSALDTVGQEGQKSNASSATATL